MYNHKQRREMEKNLGLLKEYHRMNEAEKAEIRKKKREAGNQIHLRNLQEAENARIQAEADRDAVIMQNLIEQGKSHEEAEEHVRKNREHAEKRALDLAERKRRQEEKALLKKSNNKK
jgi:menaquinone-dependent protoporphyrinogen IX oxidase